jgi:hypothetical protein
MKIKQELIENGDNESELNKIKISTHDIFKKQFEFPEVAKNDFSTEVLDELEIAEKNLNSNMDNVDLFNTFVDVAESCRKKLKYKYADQWHDPGFAAEEKVEINNNDNDE